MKATVNYRRESNLLHNYEGALIGPRNRFSSLSLQCRVLLCYERMSVYIQKERRLVSSLSPLSLSSGDEKKSGKCRRERVTSLEKNGRYNTKWQLRAFKYSHDRSYRRKHSCWKKGQKNDEQLFDFKSGLCIIQQKPNCSIEQSSLVPERMEGRLFCGRRWKKKRN